MTDINQLLDQLQDLVDDKRERVAKLFADIRASVPRPMTLVFDEVIGHPSVFRCHTPFGCYEYVRGDGRCVGDWNDVAQFVDNSETGIVKQMQSHFDAAWSAMTAKGAAT